jgi:hypothetical protein
MVRARFFLPHIWFATRRFTRKNLFIPLPGYGDLVAISLADVVRSEPWAGGPALVRLRFVLNSVTGRYGTWPTAATGPRAGVGMIAGLCIVPGP